MAEEANVDLEPIIGILLIVWGVVTAVLVLLFIRRSMLSMQEEDQLFLDKAEEHLLKEQQVVVGRIQKMDRLVWVTGILSAVLLLMLAGVWIYHGLTREFSG
ncbi:MAG: hypothetical protein ACRD5W_01480 [Candidatus Acidiferrales bacterium]